MWNMSSSKWGMGEWTMKRWCLRMLLAALLLMVPGVVLGEGQQEPMLGITFAIEGEMTQAYIFTMGPESNDTWIWMELSEDVPLDAVQVFYSLAEEGSVKLATTFGDPLASQSKNPFADFTASHVNPYRYAVISSADGSVLWSGWLTVTHEPRPLSLPRDPHPAQPPVIITEAPNDGEAVIREHTEAPAVDTPTDPPPPPTDAPPIIIEPTEAPATVAPTPLPTQTQTPMPTNPPTPTPAPTATLPPSQIGYGVVTTNNASIHLLPGGVSKGTLPFGEALYISGQQLDGAGQAWHVVTVMASGQFGYLRASDGRLMNEQELYDYLHRPTQAPMPTPSVEAFTGYARVTWQNVSMRQWQSADAPISKYLALGDVVYVMGTSPQAADGTRWHSVRAEDSAFGYIAAGSVTQMTEREVDAYLASLRPTARPTVAPTLNPDYTYAVVKMNNVNLRKSPGGETLRRINSGTIVRQLADATLRDGHEWYYVEYDGDYGYLRGDMLDFIQVKPTATVTPWITAAPAPTAPPVAVPTPTPWPSPSPAPTPSPVPSAQPTARPRTLLDNIRSAFDGVRYADFARADEAAVSYTVADLDGDGVSELLLVRHHVSTKGVHSITLDAYRMEDAETLKIASWEVSPVLARGTEMEVILFEQEGRYLVYTVQRDTPTGRATASQGITLTQDGWVAMSLTASASNPRPLLYAQADILIGRIQFEDQTGLRAFGEGGADAPDAMSLSAILQVFIQLFGGMSEGNG